MYFFLSHWTHWEERRDLDCRHFIYGFDAGLYMHGMGINKNEYDSGAVFIGQIYPDLAKIYFANEGIMRDAINATIILFLYTVLKLSTWVDRNINIFYVSLNGIWFYVRIFIFKMKIIPSTFINCNYAPKQCQLLYVTYNKATLLLCKMEN